MITYDKGETMKHRSTLKMLAFVVLLAGSTISFTGIAHADCPAGYNNNLDINVATGESVYYCTPADDPNIAAYDPHLNPAAPVAAAEFTPEAAPTMDAIVVAPVIDPNDPFPLLATGEQLPGTLVEGDQLISCPDGAGKGIDINVKTGAMMSYCVKTYHLPDPSLADPTLSMDTTITTADTPTVTADPPLIKFGGLGGTGVARGD